jgi:hypothetical protein
MGRNTPDEKSGRPSSESHIRLSGLMSAELGADCLWCHNDFGKRPANEDDVYEWHYARDKRFTSEQEAVAWHDANCPVLQHSTAW